jgi:HlyD family secretion protein
MARVFYERGGHATATEDPLDIPRARPQRRRHPALLFAAIGGVLALATLGLTRLGPAAPEVEKATLLIDTVKRGPLLRQIHANGTLVAEDQRIVSALTAGRVDQVRVRAGARVEAGTVLVELSNPDVQLEALDAERQLKLAEAELASLRVSLETARLGEEAALASSRTELNEAKRAAAVAERLNVEGLTSGMEVDRAHDRLAEAQLRFDSETRRRDLADQSLKAQVELRQADVERLRAIARFQRERVTSMRVVAGSAGTVQALNLEPGQWVQSGQQLARLTSSDRLKAVLLVAESQARDVAIGQTVSVDTRNGVAAGRVSRSDPSVQNGTVAVDVTFDEALPRGARPDLSVDGTIEIERLASVLSMGLPAEGGSETSTRLFRVESDGHAAVRVPVRLGRASFNAVEILGGLREGDRVILSEMSRWSNVDRVRLR